MSNKDPFGPAGELTDRPPVAPPDDVDVPLANETRGANTPVRLGALAIVVGAVATALGALGVGGYRAGLVFVAIPLVLGTAVATALLFRRAPQRWTWVAAAAVFGLTVSGLLVQNAPPSKGVLSDRLDALRPPFFELDRATASGHSWCRPTCPVVEHRLRTPGTGDMGVMLDMAGSLIREGYLQSDEDARRFVTERSARVVTDSMVVEIRLDGTGEARRLVLTASATRD